MRVEVKDGGPGFEPPPPPSSPSESTSGWGLYLVARIADRWGVETGDDASVWFELDKS